MTISFETVVIKYLRVKPSSRDTRKSTGLHSQNGLRGANVRTSPESNALIFDEFLDWADSIQGQLKTEVQILSSALIFLGSSAIRVPTNLA